MKSKIKETIFKKYDSLVESTKNIKLEQLDVDKFCRDSIQQPALVTLDYFLQ